MNYEINEHKKQSEIITKEKNNLLNELNKSNDDKKKFELILSQKEGELNEINNKESKRR